MSNYNKQDNVNHPKHYTKLSFETIEIIDELMPHYPSFISGHLQNVVKYLFRAPFKDNMEEDLKKAQFYLNHSVKLIGNQVKFIDNIPEMNIKRTKKDTLEGLYRYEPTESEWDDISIEYDG